MPKIWTRLPYSISGTLDPIVQVRKSRHRGVICPVSHDSQTGEPRFKPRQRDCNGPGTSGHCQAGSREGRQERVEAIRKPIAWATVWSGEGSQGTVHGSQRRSRSGEVRSQTWGPKVCGSQARTGTRELLTMPRLHSLQERWCGPEEISPDMSPLIDTIPPKTLILKTESEAMRGSSGGQSHVQILHLGIGCGISFKTYPNQSFHL